MENVKILASVGDIEALSKAILSMTSKQYINMQEVRIHCKNFTLEEVVI